MSERPEGDSRTTDGVTTTTEKKPYVPPVGRFLWDVPEVNAYLEARGKVPQSDWNDLTSGAALAEQHPELAELRQKAEEAIHRLPGYKDQNAETVLDKVVQTAGEMFSSKKA